MPRDPIAQAQLEGVRRERDAAIDMLIANYRERLEVHAALMTWFVGPREDNDEFIC